MTNVVGFRKLRPAQRSHILNKYHFYKKQTILFLGKKISKIQKILHTFHMRIVVVVVVVNKNLQKGKVSPGHVLEQTRQMCFFFALSVRSFRTHISNIDFSIYIFGFYLFFQMYNIFISYDRW